ncbi:MAG: hypothetical protein UZ21_OP11001000794 [Microgenomates bacterium OLB22]|nr:MAG: hypothetical protein UZ21_OP11001000794 [Microgenomates bacterium OLB22]
METLGTTYTFHIVEGRYHPPDDRHEDGQGPFILVMVDDFDSFQAFLRANLQSYGIVIKDKVRQFMINGVPGAHIMPDGSINHFVVVGGRRAHCWYLVDEQTLIWTDYKPAIT